MCIVFIPSHKLHTTRRKLRKEVLHHHNILQMTKKKRDKNGLKTKYIDTDVYE